MNTLNMFLFIMTCILLSVVIFMFATYVLLGGQEIGGTLAVFVLVLFFGTSFWICRKLVIAFRRWLKQKSETYKSLILIIQVVAIILVLMGFQGFNF